MKGIIGIVGGMGTYAGIDLLSKIADKTGAGTDQEHLPLIMISEPHRIADRTEYLLGHIKENPGYAIADIACMLAESGASIVALPCNTAHVPEILDIVSNSLPAGCRLVNMIEEVEKYLSGMNPVYKRVGLLATNGTVESGVYTYYLTKGGIDVIYPGSDSQYQRVHPSIYDPGYGIKAQTSPVSERARSDLLDVAGELIKSGAEALVLGCTEIPMALTEDNIKGVPVIDASTVLALALVREYRDQNIKY